MSRRTQSRKFVSPAFKGDKFQSKEVEPSDNKLIGMDETKVKEHNVVVPEANAALSPAEGAEEPGQDLPTSEGSTVTPPDQRIDNSKLPPIKRKKPESRMPPLQYRMKPTMLNFEDVCEMELS